MSKKLTLALVIATYNRPEALKLVLESVRHQLVLPDEIIIADDGSGESTKKLIDSYRKKFTISLKHFWHRDDGFQKTIILNQAIAGTQCDYIVQVDGDIVLHKYFIKDHIRAAEKGFYIRGSRVMLGENKSLFELEMEKLSNISAFSAGIHNRINALRIPALAPLWTRKSSRSDNVSGCNCAFWREDFVKVNGYNNEIKGWGHEDIELAARFINIGLQQKKIKMIAVCYHLYHNYADRQYESMNYSIYEHTLNQSLRYCSKGYKSYQEQYRY
jgi:glycosyltransferase involved in cell wall biosynthesis